MYKYSPIFGNPRETKKGWGLEIEITNNEEFCGKVLIYNEAGKASSAHFHAGKSGKHEVFFVWAGRFLLNYWDEDGFMLSQELKIGQSVDMPSNTPHRLTPLIDNSIIFEVSNQHFDEDVVRFIPGESQLENEQK